jgi:hypothetical protein
VGSDAKFADLLFQLVTASARPRMPHDRLGRMLFRRLDGLTPSADPEGRHLSVEDRERQYEKAAKKENREAPTSRFGFAQRLLGLSNYRVELPKSDIRRIGLTRIRTTAVTMKRGTGVRRASPG